MPYRIREWRARYEATDRGHVWKVGESVKRKPLEYVRMPVHGRALPLGFRRLNRIAGQDAPAAFGVFVKMCEIAADNAAPLRGFVCDSQGRGLAAAEIADVLDWPPEIVGRCLTILCHPDVSWLEEAEGPEDFEGTTKVEDSSVIPGSPGVPRIPRLTKPNLTELKSIDIPPAAAAPVAPCPLAEFPRLAKMYLGIREHLQRAHPRVKLPKVDSAQGQAERAALARLVRLDGYTEGEVIHALRWVLKSEGEQAEFWRSNFRAIPALRKTRDGASKFTKIFDAMTRDPEWPPVPPESMEGGAHDRE